MIFCIIKKKKKINNHFSRFEKFGCVTSSDFAITASLLALLNSSELSQQQLQIKIPWIRGTWRKHKNTLDPRMTEASSKKDLNTY